MTHCHIEMVDVDLFYPHMVVMPDVMKNYLLL